MNDAPLKLRQSLKAQWPALIVLVCVGGLAVFAGPAGDVFEAGFAEQGVEVPDLTGGVHLVAGILASLVFFTMVVYPLLANRYSLTADQVQEVNGIIQRHTRTTRLEHVRAVNVEIGFVGRILGYGDVVFFTAGSGGDDVRLTGIDDPESVADFDRLLRSNGNRLNPGTTADLIAASLFVLLRGGANARKQR